MATLNVFLFTTLNGFYKDVHNDISWHTHSGKEEGEFSKDSIKNDGILLLGRTTYEMMKAYWPTDMAKQQNPEVAEGMNSKQKIVFSKTLKIADWENTTIVSDMVEAIKKLKQADKDMTLLGSGSILTQMADAGLVDRYQFMIDPIAIGDGTPIFNHIKNKLDLKLVDSRIFKSGTIVLTYEPLTKPVK